MQGRIQGITKFQTDGRQSQAENKDNHLKQQVEVKIIIFTLKSAAKGLLYLPAVWPGTLPGRKT